MSLPRKITSFCLISLLLTLLAAQNSFAVAYKSYRGIDEEKMMPTSEGGNNGELCITRKTKWINGGAEYFTNVNGLSFDTMFANIDAEWELDNPTCASFIAGTGAVIAAAELAATLACPISALKAIPSSAMLNPLTAVKVATNAGHCYLLLTTSIFSTSTAAACCSAVAAQAAAISAGVSTLSAIYAIADHAYKSTRICGHNWNIWQKEGNLWKRGPKQGSYADCIKNLFAGTISSSQNQSCVTEDGAKTSVTNKAFREFIYGGIEYEDTEGCKVPSTWDTAKRGKILGYSSEYQRYYMRGYGVTPNFACGRFLVTNSDSETQNAYECCRRKSQNSICIESTFNIVGPVGEKYHHKFCEVGSNCALAGVTYAPYESRADSSYICAKTYSVCPYNHLIGGGTEEKCLYDKDCAAEMDPNDTDGVLSEEERQIAASKNQTGQTKNFCQYMYHCVKKPVEPYISESGLDNGFIAKACKNMKGDSQNEYSYNSDLLPTINNRRFSAPIVQCFKETMENIFLNIAGDTKCLDSTETPDENGICASGDYLYKKGEELSTTSFFVKIQQNLQTIIKLALVLSITFMGVMVLLGVSPIPRKEITSLVIKISLIMYFALGTAWQDYFFKSVLDSSMLLSEITLGLDNPKSGTPENKLDGCQFPKYDKNEVDNLDIAAYPSGKEYLRIWDTLDCKIAQAIGFGPDVSSPNLVIMIVAGFFTGGAGIVFLLAVFFFAFYLIFLTIRAIHMFLVSFMVLVILVYVSPLTIAAALFNKTKNIFDQWLKSMLGFALQPMILFAYLGVMIALFDKILIGDNVTFDGDGISAPKSISCSSTSSQDSIYCIFNVAQVKTCGHGKIECPGFEIIGLTIPFLEGITKDKIVTIMKAALAMYIFTQFMDKISILSQNLVGGNLPKVGNWGNLAGKDGIMGSAYDGIRGIQSRATRGLKKHQGKVTRPIGGAVKSATKSFGKAIGELLEEENPTLEDVIQNSAKNKKQSSDLGDKKEESSPTPENNDKNITESSSGNPEDTLPSMPKRSDKSRGSIPDEFKNAAKSGKSSSDSSSTARSGSAKVSKAPTLATIKEEDE